MRIANPGRKIPALIVGLLFAAGVPAQQVIYPAKGQKPEQQKKDEGECHTWAVGQSKYDPTNPPAQTAAAPPPPQGASRGSGARGAARGAVVGEIVNDDASSGAAVGAVAARGQSRRQNNAAAAQQSASTSPQSSAGMDAYQKARAACLEGRGYTVK